MSANPNAKKNGKPGRPSKLTDALAARIVDLLRSGCFLETAAAAAGVSRDSLHTWLRKGAAQATGPHRRFSDAVAGALSTAEATLSATVVDAARGERDKDGKLVKSKDGRPTQPPDWRAAAWHLSHGPAQARWRPKAEVEISGEGVAPIVVYLPAEDEP